LEKLTIQDHSEEIRLTDITVHFALLRLENLKTLEIGRFQISDAYFQMLKNHVNVTQSYDSDSESSEAGSSSDSSLELD
jgi:dTDP-4-amino-4,6-dideoxygalactose transaminase